MSQNLRMGVVFGFRGGRNFDCRLKLVKLMKFTREHCEVQHHEQQRWEDALPGNSTAFGLSIGTGVHLARTTLLAYSLNRCTS